MGGYASAGSIRRHALQSHIDLAHLWAVAAMRGTCHRNPLQTHLDNELILLGVTTADDQVVLAAWGRGISDMEVSRHLVGMMVVIPGAPRGGYRCRM